MKSKRKRKSARKSARESKDGGACMSISSRDANYGSCDMCGKIINISGAKYILRSTSKDHFNPNERLSVYSEYRLRNNKKFCSFEYMCPLREFMDMDEPDTRHDLCESCFKNHLSERLHLQKLICNHVKQDKTKFITDQMNHIKKILDIDSSLLSSLSNAEIFDIFKKKYNIVDGFPTKPTDYLTVFKDGFTSHSMRILENAIKKPENIIELIENMKDGLARDPEPTRDMITFLSENCIPLDLFKTIYGYNAFTQCCRYGYLKIAELLIDKVDVNSKDDTSFRRTPLLHAIRNRSNDIVTLLLSQPGIDLNVSDYYWTTPLLQAIIFDNYKVAIILIKKGADVNEASIYGETPLSAAIKNKAIDIIESLLDREDLVITEEQKEELKFLRVPSFLKKEREGEETVEELLKKVRDEKKDLKLLDEEIKEILKINKEIINLTDEQIMRIWDCINYKKLLVLHEIDEIETGNKIKKWSKARLNEMRDLAEGRLKERKKKEYINVLEAYKNVYERNKCNDINIGYVPYSSKSSRDGKRKSRKRKRKS